MAKPESYVKEKIRTILTRHNVYYFMPFGGPYGNMGVPDFICCFHGHFLAVEAKASYNKPTARQLSHIERIREHRGQALVINEDNLSELEELLNSWEKSMTI